MNELDISDCKYLSVFDKKTCKLLLENAESVKINTNAFDCKNCFDCYYKQLKRLEQENAALRKDIKACNTCEHSTKIYSNENAKYKSALQEIKAIAEVGIHCEGMGCEFMPKILDLITKAEEE